MTMGLSLFGGMSWTLWHRNLRHVKQRGGIREKYREGTLGLDMNNMRKRLLDMGLQYITYEEDKETRD